MDVSIGTKLENNKSSLVLEVLDVDERGMMKLSVVESGNTYVPVGKNIYSTLRRLSPNWVVKEDELPPTPTREIYFNVVYNNHLQLTRTSTGGVHLLIRDSRGEVRGGIQISADTALDLSHDIHRMALALKREGKQ